MAKGTQPLVLAVAEAHAPVSLDEMDAIENTPPPHIAGSLEGVAALAGDQECVLVGFEPGIETVELGLAKQAAADGASGGECCIEVDEGLFRRTPFRPGRGPGIAGGGESRVDLLKIEMETADGSVAEQIHPAFHRAGIGSQLIVRPALRIGFGCHAAETEQPGDPDAGAQDRIVDHHDRDGRPGDDAGFAFGIRLGQVEAGIACGQGLDFRFRNADQNNGLGMADQPGTC